MDNIITLQVNDNNYQGFTDITISRSMVNFSDSFTFSTTIKDASQNNLDIANLFKVDNKVKIFIDDNLVLTGFIDNVNVGYSSNSFIMQLSGRDRLGDLIDSNVRISPNSGIYNIRSFPAFCRRVLDDNSYNDIKVVNNVSKLSPIKFDEKEIINTSNTGTIFDFLDKYAKKIQVLLINDIDGNLVITRGEQNEIIGSLLNENQGQNNNIINCSFSSSNSDRYHFIDVYSQQSNDTHDFNQVSISSSVIDLEVRRPRRKTIIFNDPTNRNQLKDYGTWFINIKKSKGVNLTYTTQGYYTNQGDLWDINKLVAINDEFLGLNDEFLIKSVTFQKSDKGGSITILDLVNKNSFSLF